MIFGFLRKFRIDIGKNPHKNKKNRDQQIFSKKSKTYFSRPKKFRRKNLRKSQWKMKISKFRKFPEKIEILKCSFFIDFSDVFFPRKIVGLEKYFFEENFQISNFENWFSSWKINIFWSGFFSWQGMVMYLVKIRCLALRKHFGVERHGQTQKFQVFWLVFAK